MLNQHEIIKDKPTFNESTLIWFIPVGPIDQQAYSLGAL
jgi:hypothetical protein